MKQYIDSAMLHYPSLYRRPVDVLEHLFCTLGNGVDLTRHGMLTRYGTSEAYEFGAPVPLTHVYPWNTNETFQPFRKYVGCQEVGFKEAVKYFVECLKITPDDVERIGSWKENAQLILDVLVNQEVVEPTRYDIGDFEKWKIDCCIDAPTNTVCREWVFDPVSGDVPHEVTEEVRDLWRAMGLGNDVYRATVSVDEELFEEYPHLYFWLIHAGLSKDETVHIHYWW